jgi:C4-type Zn-finger protein
MNRQCPCCKKGLGLVQSIDELPESPDRVLVWLHCTVCDYDWNVERPTKPAKFIVPTPPMAK